MIIFLERHYLTGLVVLSLFCLGCLIGNFTANTGLHGAVMVVDAGHGGIDGGCQDLQGHLEKEINLAIAKRVAVHLGKAGVKAILTRDDDRDLGSTYSRDLHARLEIARNAHPLAMISIHANWHTDPAAWGALVVVPPASPQSERLAKAILSKLPEISGTRADPVVMPDHPLLAQEAFPIALVETGFLSNPGEAKLLQSASYQNSLAAYIVDGVLDYLSTTDL